MQSRAWWCVVLMLTACDGTPADPDGGTQPDAASFDDAGMGDAGSGDAGMGDAGLDAATSCACSAGEACVRGVCIDACGGDVSAFEDALGAGLTPVASFCRAAHAYAVLASGAERDIYDVTTSVEGLRTVFALSRWPLDESVSTPSPLEVTTATHDAASADEAVFPGGYLALDPTGARAVFGYTTSGDGFPGGVFYATIADGAVAEVAAPGNFDAAWIDASRFVVDGSGLDGLAVGQGLYVADLTSGLRAVHVATNMGAYSGSVAASSAFVIGGAVTDGTFESHVYAFPNERVEAALADEVAIDVASDAAVIEVLDPDGAAVPSTFSIAETRMVSAPFGGPLTSWALASEGGAVTLSDARVLATGSTFTDAIAAGDGQLLLVHASGLLLVQQ